MSNLLSVFNFESHQVRTTSINNEIWFIAKDVCAALNLTDTNKTVERLDEDEKGTSLIRTLGGQQNMLIINESGMYTLVLRCRDAVKKGTLPHRFRKWVTSEVLPSIRKTGTYLTTYNANYSKPLQIEIDCYNINALVKHYEFIMNIYMNQIDPALRQIESPLAGRIIDHVKDGSIFAHYVQNSLMKQLPDGATPRIM